MKSDLLPKRDLIMELLRENGHKISDDETFSLSRIGTGKGLASLLFKVCVADRSYAVKITDPRSTVDGYEDLVIHASMHNREVDFYRWASQLPETDMIKFKLPKFFGGRYCSGDDEGILILEDFTDRMITEIDFFKGFSIDLVKDIIHSIVGYQSAHLHANTKFHTRNKRDVYEPLMKISITSIAFLSEKSRITEATKKKLHTIAEDIENLVEQYPAFAKEAQPMLLHSDLWPNNMLYGRAGEDLRLLAVIDWQCATIGNALFDVSIVCSLSLTAEMRRAHDQHLIELYWKEMKNSCGTQFNIDLETAHKLYRHCMKWSAVMMAIMMYLRNLNTFKPGSLSDDEQLSERLNALLEDISHLMNRVIPPLPITVEQ